MNSSDLEDRIEAVCNTARDISGNFRIFTSACQARQSETINGAQKYLTSHESYAIMLSITIAVCDLIQEGKGTDSVSFLFTSLQNGVPYNRTNI